MKKRKNLGLGCNLGLRKMVVVLVVLFWGEGVIPIPTYIYI
jgi:hypothetical protein